MVMPDKIYPLRSSTVIHFPTNAQSDGPFFSPFLHRLAARAASPGYGPRAAGPRAACPPNSVAYSFNYESQMGANFMFFNLSWEVRPMVIQPGRRDT